ncbi:TPA: hypothetical protein ACKRQV_001268 [Pseudomonas aeruginosa]
MTATANPIDPRIGMLIRNGVEVFYAYHEGVNRPPVEGSLQQVETALDIRSAQPEIAIDDQFAVSDPQCKKPLSARTYAVTVKPSVTLYSGSVTIGESVEMVDAHTRREAVNIVRQRLRDVNGRFGPKYNVTARLADGS